MSSKCEACGRTGVEVGSMGLPDGEYSQRDFVEQLRENVAFRVQSITSILMGPTSNDGDGPMERRKKLMENRRMLATQLPGPLGSMAEGMADSPQSTSRTPTDTGSSESRPTMEETSSGTSSSSSARSPTPAMSEVNRGTKKRADDRGYGA
jgi:hypothetical protein